MQRHHVHLSVDKSTTLQVGARRGRPVLLTIVLTPKLLTELGLQ
jgi:RNA:NAD 2'-phosphotransferase (TPT1/KptA family)